MVIELKLQFEWTIVRYIGAGTKTEYTKSFNCIGNAKMSTLCLLHKIRAVNCVVTFKTILVCWLYMSNQRMLICYKYIASPDFGFCCSAKVRDRYSIYEFFVRYERLLYIRTKFCSRLFFAHRLRYKCLLFSQFCFCMYMM